MRAVHRQLDALGPLPRMRLPKSTFAMSFIFPHPWLKQVLPDMIPTRLIVRHIVQSNGWVQYF